MPWPVEESIPELVEEEALPIPDGEKKADSDAGVAIPADSSDALPPTDDSIEPSDGPGADTAGSPDVPTADAESPGDAEEESPPLSEDPCDWELESTTQVPLGETLFLDGDDYLAFWNPQASCDFELVSIPAESGATIVGSDRLTPDVTGEYVLMRGKHRAVVDVRDDLLNEDTFINYNYTPAAPLLALDETTLLVATTTSSSVSRVTLSGDSGEETVRIPVGGWPTGLALTADQSTLLVTQTARDSLGFVSLEEGRLTDAIHVGDEPTGILVTDMTAWIALSGANQVAQVDLDTRTVVQTLDVGREPRAMVLDAERNRLYVASLISSNEHPRGPIQGADEELPLLATRDIAIIDTAAGEVVDFVPHVGTILRGLWLSADGDTLVVGVSHSQNQKLAVDAESRPHVHGLAFVDVSEDLPLSVTQLDLDQQESSTGAAPSPFSMLADPDTESLWITLSAGASVLEVDSTTFAEKSRTMTGNDPRGLIRVGDRMWTYAWLDNRLDGFSVAEGVDSTSIVSIPVGVDPTPEDIKIGQRIFNDGAFSKYGAFSCNNCHVDGLTDGLVWDLLVDGPVNTPAFRNIGGTGPFLWGGLLPTLFDFSREVLKLVGADATGEQMELLTLYMQSVTAPPNPAALPGGKLTPLALQGKEIFETQANCISCHSGPLFTNQSQVIGKTPELTTDVPALIGVYDTAPFGREGQWATLEEMVDFAVDYMQAELTPEEMEALTQYVREVPGDALYLNSATPLDGNQHVWFEKQVELTFSNVLTAGQEEHFTLEVLAEENALDGEPLPGQWVVSGRIARFEPEEPLPLETHFRVRTTAGLTSVMGQTLYQDLDLAFRTGGLPETDVSGTWNGNLNIQEPISASVSGEFAFLQSSGGKVSGVILVEVDEITLSHFEAVVSGTTLVLDPFLLDTSFGEIMVEGGQADLIDLNGDGLADFGEGSLTALGLPVELTFERIKMPDGSAYTP